MKNFRKSKKALSPVVASIILIAVTVAVSIAVAAWMGALTVGFMGSSSTTITNVSFTDEGETIVLSVKNTGTKSVTIAQVKVNNINYDFEEAGTAAATIPAGEDTELTIDMTSETPNRWYNGNPYKIDLYDSSGQVVGSYQAVAPQ